jgi:DNA-binding transcriptional LysR family regulator
MATLVRVVDAGSLSAAARALRLSLPAVSRQLNALEAELGVRLLLRSNPGLQLTEAGQRFHAESVGILGSVERARDATVGGDAIAGRIVVSVAISVGLELIVPRLSPFLAAHRSLELELRLEDRLVDLIGEGVDVAIRAGIAPPDSTAYVAHAIGEENWRVAVAAPAYLRRCGKPTTVRQLAQHDGLVHLGPSGANRRLTFRRGEEVADVELHAPAEGSSAAPRACAPSSTRSRPGHAPRKSSLRDVSARPLRAEWSSGWRSRCGRRGSSFRARQPRCGPRDPSPLRRRRSRARLAPAPGCGTSSHPSPSG